MTKKMKYTAMLLIAGLLLGCAVCAGMSVSADRGAGGNSAAEICIYQTVIVREGDTLWSIASEYEQTSHAGGINELVCDLRRINGLSGDTVYAGNTIVVPVYQDGEEYR